MPQLKTASEKLLTSTSFLLPASRKDTKEVLSREDSKKVPSREDTKNILKENKCDFSAVICLACAFQQCGSLAGKLDP